jgi:hypothetical protein
VKIRILTSARKDLADERDFYDRQAEGVGDNFLDSLFSDIDSLALHAGIHRKVFGFHRCFPVVSRERFITAPMRMALWWCTGCWIAGKTPARQLRRCAVFDDRLSARASFGRKFRRAADAIARRWNARSVARFDLNYEGHQGHEDAAGSCTAIPWDILRVLRALRNEKRINLKAGMETTDDTDGTDRKRLAADGVLTPWVNGFSPIHRPNLLHPWHLCNPW